MLERETGIEPATNSLEGCDSTIELLPLSPPSGALSGAGEGTRTPDRLITNQMLYQLSYAGARRPHQHTAELASGQPPQRRQTRSLAGNETGLGQRIRQVGRKRPKVVEDEAQRGYRSIFGLNLKNPCRSRGAR